jgi:2-methylcitrate dehydratase
MDITSFIAKSVAETALSDMNAKAVDYSKTLALSALGAMIFGPDCTGGDVLTKYVTRAGGTPEATVFGIGRKLPVEMVAMANATFAHATEYEDDSFPEAVSSYTIFPAIFALGEQLGSSGEECIAAFILGYETQARIGLACREARRLGYMVLSLAGSIGCAAAAARLLKLDAARTSHALSIAASQGSGLGYQTGTMAHIVEMGFSARNGLAAALLARDGLTGQSDILEAPRGLFEVITAGKVDRPKQIIEDWGRPFRLMEIGIKEYPCCYHLQRMIEAALELRETEKVKADDIEEISIEVNAFFPTVVQHEEPNDELQAQFSLPHAVAAAFLEPNVVPESFSQAKIRSEAFRAFRKKIRTIVREDWGWSPTDWTPRIVIQLKDGRVVVRKPERSRGQPPLLMSYDDCIAKYRSCTEGRISETAIAESIDLVQRLETCRNVSALVQIVGTRQSLELRSSARS